MEMVVSFWLFRYNKIMSNITEEAFPSLFIIGGSDGLVMLDNEAKTEYSVYGFDIKCDSESGRFTIVDNEKGNKLVIDSMGKVFPDEGMEIADVVVSMTENERVTMSLSQLPEKMLHKMIVRKDNQIGSGSVDLIPGLVHFKELLSISSIDK